MNEKQNILITGGTGLVGSKITELLLQKNYQIRFLSRGKQQQPPIDFFQWNYAQKTIEKEAFANLQGIIHLAGAGVAEKNWSVARKKEILESRTLTTQLLYETLQQQNQLPKVFVAASAIGLYGDTGDKLIDENSPTAQGFLAEVTQAWEQEIDKIATLGIRVVKLRIGIVLSKKGGALEKLIQPIQVGAGAPLGSGNQYMSWIHLEDLARMFIFALENQEVSGVYNAVAPKPVTNKTMTELAAKVLKKPLWLPNVPPFALKLMLGEMANLVLSGSKISSQKIQNAGFQYLYENAEDALYNLLQES